MAESRMFDGSDWITVTDEEHRTAVDPHTQYALADGTRGSFAAPLGADDNYVTDAEKAALHAHANKAALDNVSGVNTGDQTLPTWTTISGKPAVVAAGATQADARTAIGAGTSSLAIGTTGSTAAAGNRAATETAIGMVELATTTEATTGTDTTRAVTPAGLKAVADTKAATSHTHTASQVSDSTTTGRALLTAVDIPAARAALGLGTAATTASTAYATAAQGATADAALPSAAAPELIRDTMAAALVAGANVTITPNDGADTITIAASGGGGGGSPAFLLPSIPGGATNPPFNSTSCPNSPGYAYGTSYPWPAGVPFAGIAFNVTTAQSGATMNVGVYDCDAIGRPKTRLNLTTGIDVSTTGRKTVAFSATPTGGLLWVFFNCSTDGDVVRLSGYNNNAVNPFVAVSTSNWESQRACKIDSSLPADAAATFSVNSDWWIQPGFHIIFPT